MREGKTGMAMNGRSWARTVLVYQDSDISAAWNSR